MTVNAITDTKKGRTGIAPTYLHTTQNWYDIITPLQIVLVGWNLIRRWRIKCFGDDDNKVKIETEKKKEWKCKMDENW